MARADGKLFEALADDVCRAVLRELVAAGKALTQGQITARLPYNPSTVSRKMRVVEDLGLVARQSARAPYDLVFPFETRQLLVAGSDLTAASHRYLAAESEADKRAMMKQSMELAGAPALEADA